MTSGDAPCPNAQEYDMKFKRLHQMMPPAMAMLIVIAAMLWSSQAISGEQAVTVFKNPT